MRPGLETEWDADCFEHSHWNVDEVEEPLDPIEFTASLDRFDAGSYGAMTMTADGQYVRFDDVIELLKGIA